FRCPHTHVVLAVERVADMFIPLKNTTVYMSKEDCVDNFQEESCSKTVIVQGVLKKEFGSRIYDKILACLYCRKLLKHRIVEHLDSKHDDQLEVVQALAKTGKERTWAIEKLKHKLNYVHNIGILQSKQSELIVARRSNTNQKYDDYLPCIHCLGFFKKGELWKHYRVCKFKPKDATSNESSTQARSRLLLSSTVETESCANFKKLHPILDTMHRDEVFSFLKNDNLILTFGNILLQKLGIRNKHNFSQRMKKICAEKPGLALCLGHNLMKCAQIKRGIALRQDDDIAYRESSKFLELLDAEWSNRVSSTAHATLKTNKFNKKDILLLTSDLVMLKLYLDKQMEDLIKTMKTNVYPVWRQLAETTLANVVIFNKRRGGEAVQLLIETYAKRGFWKDQANEIQANLSNVEKKFFSRKKQNKVVATLLTHVMITAMDLLVKHRQQCGLRESSRYIFATQGDGHQPTWQVIQTIATAAGCKQPELITSSCLRKYIATVCWVIDLSDDELEWLSSHIKTHWQYYQQQDSTVELAIVSRLLIAAEAGKLGSFSGKKLEDIDVEADDSEMNEKKSEAFVPTPGKAAKIKCNSQKQKI
ncbi:hypothetical protein ACJMK2_033619, partial [Sinanodonta woodiana]